MSESRFLRKCLSKKWHERVGGIWFTTDMNGTWFYATIKYAIIKEGRGAGCNRAIVCNISLFNQPDESWYRETA